MVLNGVAYMVCDGQSDGKGLSIQLPFRTFRHVGNLDLEPNWTLRTHKHNEYVLEHELIIFQHLMNISIKSIVFAYVLPHVHDS